MSSHNLHLLELSANVFQLPILVLELDLKPPPLRNHVLGLDASLVDFVDFGEQLLFLQVAAQHLALHRAHALYHA